MGITVNTDGELLGEPWRVAGVTGKTALSGERTHALGCIRDRFRNEAAETPLWRGARSGRR